VILNVVTLLSPALENTDKSAMTRILVEAEALFAEHGFDGVSINEVAGASGVCKANVFHHFATKQELYERVLTQACENFSRSFDRLVVAQTGLAARLTAVVEWHEAFLRERPNGTRLILRELTGSPTALAQSAVFPLIRSNFERVVALLAEASDELREGISAALVAKLVLSLNLFGFQTEQLDGRLITVGSLSARPELRRQWIDLLLHGIQRHK